MGKERLGFLYLATKMCAEAQRTFLVALFELSGDQGRVRRSITVDAAGKSISRHMA